MQHQKTKTDEALDYIEEQFLRFDASDQVSLLRTVEEIALDYDDRWAVKLKDDRLVDDPEDAPVRARYATYEDARKAAIKVSRMEDLYFDVWDCENNEYVEGDK